MIKHQLAAFDSETLGLNCYTLNKDGERVHGALFYKLIEIALILPKLESNGILSYEGCPSIVVGIKPNEHDLENANPWSIDQHTKSGLFERLETREGFDFVVDDAKQAEALILAFLENNGIRKFDRNTNSGAVALGNNINFDLSFLDAQMPELFNYFSYRKDDISAVKNLNESIWAHLNFPKPNKAANHTALSDIQESIDEINLYTAHLNKNFA